MSTHAAVRTSLVTQLRRRPKIGIFAGSTALTVVGVVAAILQAWQVLAVDMVLLLGGLPPLVAFSLARTKYHVASVPAATAQLVRRNSNKPTQQNRTGASKAGRSSQVGFGVEDEWARRCKDGFAGKFESYALQSRSVRARDVLARAATDGRHDWPALSRLLRLAHDKYAAPLDAVKAFDPQFLRSIARLMVNQRSGSDDLYDALTIYRVLERLHPGKRAKSDNYLLLDATVGLRDQAAFRNALDAGRFRSRDPFHAACMEANMIGDPANPKWEQTLNAPFIAAGVEPIRLHPGPEAPFDRLHADAPARAAENDPLITVIVPTYEPDQRLHTAIHSLTNQTWQNIEVIIVDDNSSERARKVIADAAATDPRVSVIYSPENRGSYASRNAGLLAASGKYVTCHDDDDWSHPRKLELQAAVLESEESFVATMSRHVRSSEQLEFTRINVNPSVSQPNYSSIMFRRELVLEKCGLWDEVRKGADAEFKERLEACFGVKIPAVGDAPMSLTRTRLDSLTAGEMVRGYVDPRRVAYMRSFQRWHRSQPESWTLGRPSSRPFPIPPGIAGHTPESVDIVFATDFRFPGGTSSLTLGEAQACLDAGYSVGLLQLESPLNSYLAPLVGGFWEVVERGAVMLTLPDPVECGLMVMRHPSVMQYGDGLMTSRLSPRELLLVVNHLPVMKDGRGSVFDVEVAAANAQRIFGTSPAIVPESGVTRASLASVLNPARVSPENWPGFIDDAWFGEPRVAKQSRPVVGRHGRDNWIKWPASPKAILAAYDHPDLFETRVLGGVDSITDKVPAEVIQRWQVHEFNEVDPKEFVRDLDFWVFFHHKDSQESFGMAIAEAMASGAVVVLPPYLEKTFGDGAVYCNAQSVAETVRTYWADAGKYFMQSQKGIEFARENFSSKSFLQRVMDRLG